MINILINDNNDILNPGSWGEVGWILGSFLDGETAQADTVIYSLETEMKLDMSSILEVPGWGDMMRCQRHRGL
jgi:hypothetical protein